MKLKDLEEISEQYKQLSQVKKNIGTCKNMLKKNGYQYSNWLSFLGMRSREDVGDPGPPAQRRRLN